MLQQLPAIIVVTPLAFSLFIFLAGWRTNKLCFPLASAVTGGCLIVSLGILWKVISTGPIQYLFGGWPPPWGIEYRVDHMNGLMGVLISFMGFMAVIYGRRTVEKELPGRESLFWSLFTLLMTGLLGITMTGDLFNLFVLLEVASLSGYALVSMGRPQAVTASLRYLIIGTIGASFYLIGVGFLYMSTGSLNMADLKMLLPAMYSSRVVMAAFVFIFIGFAIKIALFPLHAWQPDAYTYSPSAVTVIISTAMAKTFTYALIRIIFSVFTIDFIRGFASLFQIIAWAAILAMIAGSVSAIVQNNLKRMLAYSSVSNVGYIVLGIGLAPFTSLGLTPAMMHIINHAMIKGCMFMAACAFIYRLDIWDIRTFTGLGRRMPLTCFTLIIAALAMIGMPPSAGFVTKWYLIQASLEAGRYVFVGVIFFSTLLMIVYFWRVIEIMYIRPVESGDEATNIKTCEAPLSMLIPCMILGFLTFFMGILWISGLFRPILYAINSDLGLGGLP